jgi:argininosuccinate lyase
MARRAETGFTTATAVANQLVQQGVPFRTAHHQVGEAVRRAIEAGSTELAEFGPPGWLAGLASPTDLPGQVRAHAYGGGPGGFGPAHADARAGWVDRVRWHHRWRDALAAADATLAAAVTATAGPA